MDIVKVAEEEIETFDRPSAQTSDKLIAEVKKLRVEREEAVTKLSCAELEISLLKEGNTVLHNLSEENCVLRAKLTALESQRFNVKEFIRRCQDRWGFDVKIASEMLEIAKYVPTALANKPARITEQDAYDIILNFFWFMESYKHKDAKNPSVVEWHDSEGRTLLDKLNADREQVSPALSEESYFALGDALFDLDVWSTPSLSAIYAILDKHLVTIPSLPQTTVSPSVNQCDGCCRMLPVVDGLHRGKDGLPVMTCEKNLYESSKGEN